MFVYAHNDFHKIILDVAFISLLNRLTRRLEKFTKILEKVAKTVAEPKYLYQSSIWKSKTYLNHFWNLKIPATKPYLKTGLLGKNVKHLLQQKVAQKVAISLGYFIFFKSHNWRPKVAQFVKNCRSGNLVTLLLNNIWYLMMPIKSYFPLKC